MGLILRETSAFAHRVGGAERPVAVEEVATNAREDGASIVDYTFG